MVRVIEIMSCTLEIAPIPPKPDIPRSILAFAQGQVERIETLLARNRLKVADGLAAKGPFEFA
jgi:hypothetical protein